MKKLVTVLLVLCFAFSACGSSSGPLTFDAFQEKYKRADWSVMLSDPDKVIGDYLGGAALTRDEWLKDWSLFSTADYADDALTADIVLFNRPFTAHVWDSKTKSFGGMLSYDDGNPDECFKDFTAMFESMIKNHGDPARLRINFEEVSEAAFRNGIASGAEEYDFYEATWELEGGKMMIMFNHFSDYAKIQIS